MKHTLLVLGLIYFCQTVFSQDRMVKRIALRDTVKYDISLNSKYIVVLRTPQIRQKLRTWQVHSENISRFHKTYLEDLKTQTSIYSWI